MEARRQWRQHPGGRARALGEAAAIPLFFPGVRPRGAKADALVATLTAADTEGFVSAVESLPDSERRRIVESWTVSHPERWAVLVGGARDVAVVERVLVIAALRAAVGDRKPCAPAGLAEIEAEETVHPGNALAAVIQPSTVWEYELASRAQRAAVAGDRDRTIAEIGFRCFPSCERRLRERVAWVQDQLPFRSFPRASAILQEGCDLVASTPGFDAELSCAVLEGYVRLLELGFPVLHHIAEPT